MRCASIGPRDAAIAIVGEAPGQEEENRGVPFVGASGYELTKMLNDAGISRESCFITNAVKDRPLGNDISLWINTNKTPREGETLFRGRPCRENVVKDITELHEDLRAIKPRVIIPLGNTALWALTPHRSVDKWRGSYLRSDVAGVDGTVIPTYHPAAVLRQYDWRAIAVRDLRRAAAAARSTPIPPHYEFRVCDTFARAMEVINLLNTLVEAAPTVIVCDLEIKRQEIVCFGLGWSKTDAACFALYNYEGRTFTAEETTELWLAINALFSHPNCRLVNQNISFDIQYLYEKAGVWPRAWFDTMIAQNVLFPGTPKSLDYLASLYADWYVYWKDDGKFWDRPIVFEQLWEYNCLDCAYTYEVYERQVEALAKLNLTEQMNFMMRLFQHLVVMMVRGVRVSETRKRGMLDEITTLVARLGLEIDDIVGRELNVFSPKQLQEFFYKRMGVPPIINRKTKSPTTDDDALRVIGKNDPILAPITRRIALIRSYKTAVNVCNAKTSSDGRWRCSFNPAGTENYRLSSAENPFGEGLNLQNLTLGKEIT